MTMKLYRIVAVLVALIAGGPSLGQPPKWMGVRQTIAHRGSSADRPECTLASVRRAIDAGATAAEVDIRLTQDNVLVILHDATLDRTTNGTGRLDQHTLEQVRQLDAGSWFDARYKGEKVPTLAEVLTLCREKIDIVLDLKLDREEYVDAVVAEVKKYGDPKRTIVGVRSVAQARQFRELLPEARQLGLIAKPEHVEAYIEAGVRTIRLWPKWLDDPDLVARVRRGGAMLHLNGTTGKPDEVAALLKYQPDSLSSDDPARLNQSLAELQRE